MQVGLWLIKHQPGPGNMQVGLWPIKHQPGPGNMQVGLWPIKHQPGPGNMQVVLWPIKHQPGPGNMPIKCVWIYFLNSRGMMRNLIDREELCVLSQQKKSSIIVRLL